MIMIYVLLRMLAGMSKKDKYKPAASYGDDFENKIDQWSNAAKLEFYTDKTLDNSKRRKKNLSTDRRYVINGVNVFVELKTCREGQPLSYNITLGPEKRHLKQHQIAKMHYLIYETRPHDPIVISKKDLMWFAANHKKNSINYKDALKIGLSITNMEWIKDIPEVK